MNVSRDIQHDMHLFIFTSVDLSIFILRKIKSTIWTKTTGHRMTCVIHCLGLLSDVSGTENATHVWCFTV